MKADDSPYYFLKHNYSTDFVYKPTYDCASYWAVYFKADNYTGRAEVT